MGVTVVLCAVSAVLGALAGGLWFRRREKRTLQSLDGMLDQAICGEFSPTKFDESLFSAVESRLADYLEASAVSARNLQAEKDAIKTLIGDILPPDQDAHCQSFVVCPAAGGAASAPPGPRLCRGPGETGGEIKNPH